MKKIILLLSLIMFPLTLLAEIVTDGSLGPPSNLPGPDYQIEANLGQPHGGNLFHSFQEFNLQFDERATFSGPNTVQNIISRVTGGNPSQIDGVIRSTIPNADLYFLNPYGIFFGPNASLDVPGSFHASTADYLRLGNGGYFSAHLSNESVLTVAPVEAFGFINKNVGQISIQGSLIFNILENKSLSFIGGDLFIDNAILFAPSGRINLVAVADDGEVKLTTSDIVLNDFEQLGQITLLQDSISTLQEIGLANLDVGGLPGGQIFIRAGQFYLDKGLIFADTYGGKGLGIDIVIDGKMQILNGARITADNCPPFGENCDNSQGGNISLTAQVLQLSGRDEDNKEDFASSLSGIATNNFSDGTGGNINIKTSRLEINTGLIQAATEKDGAAGNIHIQATDSIFLENQSAISVSTAEGSSGHAGNIHVETQRLALNFGQINSFSLGSGNASSIKIAANTALLNDSDITTVALHAVGGEITLNIRERLSLNNTWITAEVEGDEIHDNAGDITISQLQFLTLHDSRLIASANRGNGGNINIQADQIQPFGDTQINASSLLGLNGQLIINDIDISQNLTMLPTTYTDPTTLIKEGCHIQFGENPSSFFVVGRDGSPTAPDDFQTDSRIFTIKGQRLLNNDKH